MTDVTINPTESRPLTEQERVLIEWLLTRGAEITGTDAGLASSFLKQLSALRVVGRCGCGCPSINLALSEPELAVSRVTATLADVEGCSPEGSAIGVILRARNGQLSELELYARDAKLPFSLPGKEELQLFW